MKFKRILLLALLLSSGPVYALIDIKPKIVEVQPDKTGVVTIINRGDRREYVTISLSRLLNPGVPYEQERVEPVGMARNPALYAYPFQLALSPGQSKEISLKPLVTVKQEQVYRLEIRPATAFNSKNTVTIAGGVAVNLSFSALVRQMPEKQTSEITTSCEAGGATLTASGTVRYTVSDMKADGIKLDDFNIYPGESLFKPGRVISLEGKVICR